MNKREGSDLSPVTGCGRQSRSYVDRRDNRINHHRRGGGIGFDVWLTRNKWRLIYHLYIFEIHQLRSHSNREDASQNWNAIRWTVSSSSIEINLDICLSLNLCRFIMWKGWGLRDKPRTMEHETWDQLWRTYQYKYANKWGVKVCVFSFRKCMNGNKMCLCISNAG